MSINIRNVPNYEELLEYVPKSNYMRNAVTQNRRITKLNSEQPLGGMAFQPNLEAVFRIAPSTSTLLNLAECYFSITGHMMRQAIDGETMVPALKVGCLFLLKCINKIVLQVGGCAVHTITTPALLAKLYESLAINHNDKERGALYEDGFYSKDSIDHYFGFSKEKDSGAQDYYIDSQSASQINFPSAYYNGDLTVSSNTTASPPTPIKVGYVPFKSPLPPFNHITFEGLIDYANPKVPESYPADLDIRGGLKAWSWMFKQNLKLKDIFPIEKLKPIYGQEVSIRIQFDSKGFTGILDSYGGSPLIYFFQQFYLNVYQYNINVEMINKLNQIYSKPVVEIIDAVDRQLQSIASISANNEVQIFIPLQMQFETDYIAIYMPHNISNNANDGLILGKAGAKTLPNNNTAINLNTDGLGGIMNYKSWKNFCEHTPMDHRFMNINRIQVECDGEILYQRTFNENPYKANMPMPYRNTAFSSLVNNLNPTTAGANNYALTGVTTIPLNDYTNAYELYKECRCYWDVTEESAMPFQEWLYSGFAIIIPSSPFSRLTTGSNLTISINFGEGMTNTPSMSQLTTIPVNTDANGGSRSIGINERISQVTNTQIKTEVLNQICVVQKYKKALVYSGFNNCSIRTITQSFEQDIQVTEANDTQTTAD
jgi:hypothetical protein